MRTREWFGPTVKLINPDRERGVLDTKTLIEMVSDLPGIPGAHDTVTGSRGRKICKLVDAVAFYGAGVNRRQVLRLLEGFRKTKVKKIEIVPGIGGVALIFGRARYFLRSRYPVD